MGNKDRILKNVTVNLVNGCWEWNRSVDDDGYARLEATPDNKVFVHRYSYECFIGEIPDKMTVEHKCRNRKCCNPEHFELLSRRDNVLSGDTIAARNIAKTHCLRGHEFDEENTHHVRGERVCKKCAKIRSDNRKNGLAKKRESSVLEKIIAKLIQDGAGCLVWTGNTNADGYGQIQVSKKLCFVHKIYYQELYGKIPDGLGVYRKCGNKLCCAVEHLHLLPLGSVPSQNKIISFRKAE